MSRPMTTEYALYKGEKFICMGTVKEIAEEMGVTEKTVYWWHSPTNKVKRPAKNKVKRPAKNKNKNVNNRKYLVKIEDDEGED